MLPTDRAILRNLVIIIAATSGAGAVAGTTCFGGPRGPYDPSMAGPPNAGPRSFPGAAGPVGVAPGPVGSTEITSGPMERGPAPMMPNAPAAPMMPSAPAAPMMPNAPAAPMMSSAPAPQPPPQLLPQRQMLAPTTAPMATPNPVAPPGRPMAAPSGPYPPSAPPYPVPMPSAPPGAASVFPPDAEPR